MKPGPLEQWPYRVFVLIRDLCETVGQNIYSYTRRLFSTYGLQVFAPDPEILVDFVFDFHVRYQQVRS
jgi:hypothetical protein